MPQSTENKIIPNMNQCIPSSAYSERVISLMIKCHNFKQRHDARSLIGPHNEGPAKKNL